MTEFKHTTTTVVRSNQSKFNSSPSLLYVDLEDGNWDQGVKTLKSLFAQKAKVKQGHADRIFAFLWKGLFNSRHDFRTQKFWDDALVAISNPEVFEAPKYAKDQLKAAFGECLEVMVQNNCVLMPFVPSRSQNTPTWHSDSKPSIANEKYFEILELATSSCAVSNARRVKTACNIIFSSLNLVDEADFTPELNEFFKEAEKSVFPEKNITLLNLSKQAINELAVKNGKARHFQVRRIRRVTTVAMPRSAALNCEQQYVPQIDNTKVMEDYLTAKLAAFKIQNAEIWQEEVSRWVLSQDVIKIAPLYTSLENVWEWMSRVGLDKLAPYELERHMFVRSTSRTKIDETFYECLKGLDLTDTARKKINLFLIDFFAHCFDRRSDEIGEIVKSPLSGGDKKRFVERGARGSGKSNKPVLPRRIIEMAKEVLLEGDYAFARRFDSHWASNSSGDKVFVPTISNLLFLILSVPIRTAQAVMLDSGEADEYETFINGFSAKNEHELAQKGRQLGCFRTFSDNLTGLEFTGIYVNTNKENALEQKGYEIPYHDKKLMEVLSFQRDWQKLHNPTTVMVDRSQVGPKDWRYQGRTAELPKFCFLFRDLAKGDAPWDLPSRAKIADLWVELLLEIQERLVEEDETVSLVWRDEKDKLRTHFTLHSLRVSNITHFVEAGVPLHVLAEFLSGHHTLLMTLYYTKIGPVKINDMIQKAHQNLLDSEEDEFFDELTKLAEAEVSALLVGKNDALSAVPNGNPGLWHVDVDGVCVAGKSRCYEGMERRDFDTGTVGHDPIYPNSFNCALCRFHMTGPAFLAGQVTTANTLLYAIQQRSDAQSKLFGEREEALGRGNKRRAQRLQDQWDKIEVELEEMIASLGARIGNIYASLKLLNEQEDDGSETTALITQLPEPEISASLSEAKSIEQIEFVSQAVEFFPQLPDNGASVRKGTLLDQLALENGIQPLLLRLNEEERHKAGNRLTQMMSELFGQSETIDLLDGKSKLTDLCITKDFESMLGQAISLAKKGQMALGATQKLIGDPANG